MSKKLYDKIMTILMWTGVFLFLCALSTLGLTQDIHGAMAHDIFATGVKIVLLLTVCYKSKNLNARRLPIVATIYLLCRFASFALTDRSQKLGIHNVLMVLADVFARPFIWLAWKLGYSTALSAVIGARGFTSAWWTFTLIADFIFITAIVMFCLRNKIISIGKPISNKLANKLDIGDAEDPTDAFFSKCAGTVYDTQKEKNWFLKAGESEEFKDVILRALFNTSIQDREHEFQKLCFAAHQLDNETSYELLKHYHNKINNKPQFIQLNEQHLISRKIMQELDEISLIFSLSKGSWENDFFVNCYNGFHLIEEKTQNKQS